MPPADAVEMYVALMNFTGAVHPNVVTNVNQVCVMDQPLRLRCIRM
jgi:hypothetical protein